MPIYTIRVNAKADITQEFNLEAPDEEFAQAEAIEQMRMNLEGADILEMNPDPETETLDIEED